MSARVVLTVAQQEAGKNGQFVRVDLADSAGDPRARHGVGRRSVLVGRVDGVWRAYANVCRHRALPLDLGVDSPMSADGRFLECSQHGALYRIADGACVEGPCEGAALRHVPVTEDSGGLVFGEEESEEARYPYLSIEVETSDEDEAVERLFALGAAGVEQRDATTLTPGAPGRITIIASFDQKELAEVAATELPLEWSPRIDEVVGDAWRDEWKKHFEPFRIAASLVVTPPWREYAPAPGESVIVLEPGRAFGTGLHETTRLVARALAERADLVRGATVLDVGCGSGILSLLALALGATSARAIDVDPEAVLATQENAARNGVGDRLLAEGIPLQAIGDRYAVVVANIEAPTLVELAPALIPRLAPRGLLVLSGILAPRVAPEPARELRKAYGELKEQEVLTDGEWIAMVWSAWRP